MGEVRARAAGMIGRAVAGCHLALRATGGPASRGRETGAARIEVCEPRVLLAVTSGEYESLRGLYPEFALAADMGQVHVVELTPAELTLAHLQTAVDAADGTPGDDLIVVRTTDAQNTIIYPQTSEQLFSNVAGRVSIVALGSRPLTLDAGPASGRAICVGGWNSATVFNLGNAVIRNGSVTSDDGGAVYQWNGSTAFVGVSFEDNVGRNGGAVYVEGGSAAFRNVVMSHNESPAYWGGQGGALHATGATITLAGATLVGNTAGTGGGIYQREGTLWAKGCIIDGNTGGGVSQTLGSSSYFNTLIARNTQDAYHSGAGVWVTSGVAALTNVTISRNSSLETAGGVFLVSAEVTLHNTLVAGNSAPEKPDIYAWGGSLIGENCLIGIGSGQSAIVDGVGGNQVGSDAAAIDAKLANTSQLRPLADSPAVDGGKNSLLPADAATDLWGEVRIKGAAVNIGAAEGTEPVRGAVHYVVTSLADVVAVDGVLTFREAFEAANTNLAAGDAAAGSFTQQDEITFAEGLSGDIGTGGHSLEVTEALSITGPGDGDIRFVLEGSSPVWRVSGGLSLSNVTIVGLSETVGLGIAAVNSAVVLSHVSFEGEGLRCIEQTGGSLVMDHITVAENGLGGAYHLIHLESLALATLSDVVVEGKGLGATGIWFSGDGVLSLSRLSIRGMGVGIAQLGGTMSLSDSRIEENRGSGLVLDGVSAEVSRVHIMANEAENGGGIRMEGGSATLSNVLLAKNVVSGVGGAVYQAGGILTLQNCTVFQNRAESEESYSEVGGAGIYQSPSQDIVAGPQTINLILKNTIVARNYASAQADIHAQYITGNHCFVSVGEGQEELINGSNGNQVGTAALPLNPMLVWAYSAAAPASPLPGSPVIDAGLNADAPAGTDLGGKARIQGGAVNIGAFEMVAALRPAVSYIVDSLEDTIAVDGKVTLREAITAASRNESAGDAPAGSYSSQDTITFAANLTGTVVLGQGFHLGDDVRIAGPGASRLILEGGGFAITGCNVDLSGLTITQCASGAIEARYAKLKLTGVSLRGNHSDDNGAALLQASDTTITNSLILGNSSGAGAAVSVRGGKASLANVTVAGNEAAAAYNTGVGIYFDGWLAMNNCIVARNEADLEGRGVFSGRNNLIGNSGDLGALQDHKLLNRIGTAARPIDPEFVDTTSWEEHLWDVRLAAGSMAVNGGRNDLVGEGVVEDLQGGARIQQGFVDVGCYESAYWSAPWTNHAPTNLVLSRTQAPENQENVAMLWVSDPDEADAFAFSLVTGTGSTDNWMFEIEGNQLKSLGGLDYERKRSCSIRVRVTDQGRLSYTKVLTLSVLNVNEAPTSVSVTPRTVAEHKPAGTVVGTVSGRDPDAGATLTYSLTGAGGALLAAENSAFKLVKTSTGTKLVTKVRTNYETKKSYSVIIRAKDQKGLFCDQPITISVSNINEAPTGIVLTPATVPENQPAGTVVGMLSSLDPDVGNRFMYSLVSGSGSADNGAFSILDNQLKTRKGFNYEAKQSYSIRVRSRDQGGLFCEKVIVIRVGDVAEA